MSAITVAAAAIDTDLTTLNTDIGTLITAINASQTTFQNANPNRYQTGLDGFAEEIRAAMLSKPNIAIVMRIVAQNPVAPALATQFAAF